MLATGVGMSDRGDEGWLELSCRGGWSAAKHGRDGDEKGRQGRKRRTETKRGAMETKRARPNMAATGTKGTKEIVGA